MAFRGVLRLAVFALALYSLFRVLPAYAAERCGEAERADTVPCRAFFRLHTAVLDTQAHISGYAQPYVERAQAHPWTSKATQAYSDSPIPAALSRAQSWVETQGRPRVAAAAHQLSVLGRTAAKHGYEKGRVLGTRGLAAGQDIAHRGAVEGSRIARRLYLASRSWAETEAVPFAKRQWASLRTHAIRLARVAWARIEATQIYNDWVLANYRKIVKGSGEGVFSSHSAGKDSAVFGTGLPSHSPSEEAQSTHEPAVATPATSTPEAEPEEITPAVSTPAATDKGASAHGTEPPQLQNEPLTEPLSDLDREPAKASNEDAAAAPAPIEIEPEAAPEAAEQEAAAQAAAERDALELLGAASPEPVATQPIGRVLKQRWITRLSRTVEGALSSMAEDADALAMRSIDEAKPEIMDMLREINKYGDAACKESEPLAAELESGSRKSRKISREDVYPWFETKSREMAEMALKVRARAEKLAEDVLAGLDPVRQVTLDALDDYFDVVLVEAAKQISDDNDEVDSWKEYATLKQKMREHRKRVESFDFNLDELNVALRESQMAAVVLVQDFNQQLSNIRARCQIVLQERGDEGPARAKAEPQVEPQAKPEAEPAVEPESEPQVEPEAELEVEPEAEPAAEGAAEPQEVPPVDSVESAVQPSASAAAARRVPPAAFVVDEVVELEDDAVELPVDAELDFEDSDFIDTYWETREVFQTVSA